MRSYMRTQPRPGLIKDEAGSVLAYMSVLIPVMMGVIGLAVDASRLYIVNTEQKDLADAAAIAGAYELDGHDDALIRAANAALNVVTNDPKWASDAEPEAQIVSVLFCQDLTGPAHERQCDGYTIDPKLAYHIEVITEERRVFPSFLVAVGAVAQPRSDAIAIAGSSIVACNTQPLMLCNPYEVSGVEFDPPSGQMFIFKPKDGGGNEFAPGNFGLVDPPGTTSSGAKVTRDLLTQQSSEFCYANEVNPRTGHATGPVTDGINVRFDYTFNCNVNNCDADMTAAPHVIKGVKPRNSQCKQYDAIPNAKLYPNDTSSTVVGATTIGNDTMDQAAKNAYWQFHHGENWPVDITTRYEAYIAELAMTYPTDWGAENPQPQCLPSVAEEIGPARRTIAAAIVNCLEWGVHGNSVNEIRVDSYAEFFIYKPAVSGQIFTEFVRLMTPDEDDSKLKRIVQLYR